MRVVDRADVTLFEHRATPERLVRRADAVALKSTGQTVRSVRSANDGARFSLATAPLSQERWLQIAISEEQSRDLEGHLRAGLVAVWIGAVIFGLIGGFFLTQRVLHPLRQFSATARQRDRVGRSVAARARARQRATSSTSWRTCSTASWRATRRWCAACARRSTTSPTICARR